MNIISKIIRFYYEGFKNLPKWGKQVWIIIILKLIVMFLILKLFFFPNFLKQNFSTDEERSNHVLEKLTDTK